MKLYCRKRLTGLRTGSRTLSCGKLFCQLGRTLSRCRCLSCRKAAQSMMDNQCLLPTILHQVKVSLRQSIVVCIPNRFRMIPRLGPPRTRLDQAKVFAMTLPNLLGLTGVVGVGAPTLLGRKPSLDESISSQDR